MGRKLAGTVVIFRMVARRPIIRVAVLISCATFLIFLSLELLRRSKPDFIRDDIKMLYPEIISGVWLTGFEESSFLPSEMKIPNRNDPRRYRDELIVNKRQFYKLRAKIPDRGYVAFRVTFLGRRTKYPVSIDCYGGRSYYFIPDLMLRVRYLGPIRDADLASLIERSKHYKPFKPSGEGGVIGRMEKEALARCGGTSN